MPRIVKVHNDEGKLCEVCATEALPLFELYHSQSEEGWVAFSIVLCWKHLKATSDILQKFIAKGKPE